MAITATITYPEGIKDRAILVTIAGTSVAAATEVEITGLPASLRLIRAILSLDSGAGTTVAPVIGNTTNPAGSSLLFEAAAAAIVDEQPAPPVSLTPTAGSLFLRLVPDAAADNVVSGALYLLPGWEG